MSRAADLGVPPEAFTAWLRLHDALTRAHGTPCAGPGRDRWLGTEQEQRAAADACMDCPVLRPCDAYATAADERAGVWGGFTARERQRRRGEAR